MSDYLKDARTALKARLAELEADVKRTRTALEAISPGSEEDAAAQYRQPGVHRDRISSRVRRSFDAPPGRRNKRGLFADSPDRKRFLSAEQDAQLRRAIVEALDREGMKRIELEEKVLPHISFRITRSNLLRRLREMEQQGLVERSSTGGNAQVVYRLPAESPSQNGSQAPAAVSQE